MTRVDVVIALIFDEIQEHILLVRNRSGDSSYWSLPGGAVEEGETLIQALKREAYEETGLEVEERGLHSVREVFFAERGHHALLFTFVCKISGGVIQVADPDEDIMEVKWTDLETANALMPYWPNALTKKDATGVEQVYFDQGTVN